MKKGVKIFLTIILFVAVAATAFCVWQRENLRVVYMLLTRTEPELSLSAGDAAEIPDLVVADVPEDTAGESGEEREKGGSGVKKSSRTSTSSDENKTASTVNVNELAEKCRAELYACEAQLMTRVSGMRDEVLAQWRALAPEERTSRKKREMIISGIGRCLSLESEIDGKVKAIIAKYKALAKDAGENTAEITALWDEYTAKKASTKAYYLNKYL